MSDEDIDRIIQERRKRKEEVVSLPEEQVDCQLFRRILNDMRQRHNEELDIERQNSRNKIGAMELLLKSKDMIIGQLKGELESSNRQITELQKALQ